MSRYAWLCALAVLALAGCTAKHIRTAHPADYPADARLGPGIRPRAVLIEPDDGERSLLQLINRAQTRIFVESYILSDRAITRALQRAAAEGVSVYVLLEPHPLGLGNQPQREANLLRAASVEVRWTRSAFTLTHAKFIVLDDRLAIISTANFSRAAFRANREALIVDDDGFDVKQLSNLFRDDWDRLPARMADANLIVSPDNARTKLRSLLAHARRSVWVYAEEVRDPALERLFGRLASRHVGVRVLVPPGTTTSTGRRLMGPHVAVGELSYPYVHAKVILIDGREAFVGSENVSSQSLDANREVGILVRGRVLHRLLRIFERDWARSSQVVFR